MTEIAEGEIEKMLEPEIIEYSNSPWETPDVLVKKKDGTTRFYVDFRKLKHIIRKDGYLNPLSTNCSIHSERQISLYIMDMCSGYWPMKMKDKHKKKFLFATNVVLAI